VIRFIKNQRNSLCFAAPVIMLAGVCLRLESKTQPAQAAFTATAETLTPPKIQAVYLATISGGCMTTAAMVSTFPDSNERHVLDTSAPWKAPGPETSNPSAFQFRNPSRPEY
jgi:hypothetical protein